MKHFTLFSYCLTLWFITLHCAYSYAAKCNKDKDCHIQNSTCVVNKCKCITGYIFNDARTACIKVALEYGEMCEDNIQCSTLLNTGGICEKNADGNNVCVCEKGYHYLHGQCHRSSGLGEKCTENSDCYAYAEFQSVVCNEGKCACRKEYYKREHRVCRRAALAENDECWLNMDCIYNKNASCIKMKCSTNNESQIENKNILSKREISTTQQMFSRETPNKCENDDECKKLGEAVCDLNKKCICKTAHFFANDLESCIPELGELCTEENEHGKIRGSVCRYSMWGCTIDRHPTTDNRKCLKVVNNKEDKCNNTSKTCQIFGPDAYCGTINDKSHKCLCNENVSYWVNDEEFCWTKKGLGDKCLVSIDCYEPESKYDLTCSNSVCSCPKGTHSSTSNKTCITDKSEVGEQCNHNYDCLVQHSICKNETCHCKDNFYESKGECMRGINAMCSENEKCSPKYSECLNNTCICEMNYVALNTSICIPVASFNSECEHDIQCSAVTENAICEKNEDFQANNFIVNASLIKGVCNCGTGYHYKYKKCNIRRVLGENCTSSGECYLDVGVALCKNGTCSCDLKNIQINETVCASGATAPTLLSICFGSISSLFVILSIYALHVL